MTPDPRAYLKGLISTMVHYATISLTARQSNRVLAAIIVIGSAYVMWG